MSRSALLLVALRCCGERRRERYGALGHCVGERRPPVFQAGELPLVILARRLCLLCLLDRLIEGYSTGEYPVRQLRKVTQDETGFFDTPIRERIFFRPFSGRVLVASAARWIGIQFREPHRALPLT